ncbi:TIR domain-containing protein [Nocardia salmonicida]|uniref:TIR domain-containing protein n=1 Tax=Nocardia salmonicida TaxID=53431 RepID=UPI00365F585B
MSQDLADDLRTVADDLQKLADELTESQLEREVGIVEKAAREVEDAWSGSNLGYQSRVYYQGYSRPPAGAHFSREWGFTGMFQGTTGDWEQYDRDATLAEIHRRAGLANLDHHTDAATDAKRRFFRLKESAVSILTTYLSAASDKYITDQVEKISGVSIPGFNTLTRTQMLTPSTLSRDSAAVDGGWQSAPHQDSIAHCMELRAPYVAAAELAELAESAVSHIARSKAIPPMASVPQLGTRVFIGHGRSPLWRELKDYVQDTLGLPVDEFNKVQMAGITTVARLTDILDNAAFAFLVMTAEDETADGKLTARANVIHEVGLFQGRLGFEKAIILLEEGCEDFSNVNGLTQLRFAAGRISAEFHSVQEVLKREGVL